MAPGAPFSTTQDFVALASSLILTLPSDRHSYISLFDHSHLAVLSWAVSEAYNDAALHLGAVIYTFESKYVHSDIWYMKCVVFQFVARAHASPYATRSH